MAQWTGSTGRGSQGLRSQLNEDHPIPDLRSRLKREGVRFLGRGNRDGRLRFYEPKIDSGTSVLRWTAMNQHTDSMRDEIRGRRSENRARQHTPLERRRR
jgi:hypothetical protein